MPSMFSRLHIPRRHKRPKDPEKPKGSDLQGNILSSPVSHPIAPPDPPSTLPERLWTRAYEKLQDEEPRLVEAYDTILSHKLNENPSSSVRLESQEIQMRRLVEDGLEKTKSLAKVKQSIGDVIQPVLVVNDIIGNAIHAVPQAALAWTVFNFALQMFLNPIQESKANRDGISHIIATMDWYWHLSSLLLGENINQAFMGLRGQLEDRIVGLYKQLLSYQMKSICSYHRKQSLDFLRGVIKFDDWDNELKAIRDAETAVRKYSEDYNTLQIRSRLDGLFDSGQQQEKTLQDIYHALQHQVEREDKRAQREDKEKDNECLNALCMTNPYDDMSRIESTKGGLLEDSYSWILSHQDFIDWRDKDETRLLWIKGDPGKGKTMLLIAIVRELQKSQSTHHSGLLSYFFCQGTDTRLNNATALLRGLMYQLLVQQHSLISHLRERYDKEKQLFEGVNAFYALQDIFVKMLHDLRLTRVYLVVDALDECESGLPQILDLIGRNASISCSQVKWLVSSRNRLDIEAGLRINDGTVECSLELNAESVSGAVDTYINHKVSELARMKGYDSKLEDQVRDHLRQKANETFLWVALVCKELGEEVQNWEVLELLQEIPSDLTLLYARMIEQIRQLKRRNPIYCMQVLSTSTLAYRPFHWLELAAVLPKDIPCERDNLIKIVHMCGSFLTIREETIYFIHQSAKDYLNSTSVVGSTTVDRLIFPSGRGMVHYEMVSRLLQSMEEKLRRDVYDQHDPGISIDEINPIRPDPLAQIRYACVYWIDHLCEIDSSLHDKAGLGDDGKIHKFLKTHFLHWLEALSLIRSVSQGVVIIKKIERLLSNTATDFLSMIQDANRFIQYNRFIIENSPLQVYASALVFCPTKSGIRKLFQGETPQWITTSPVVDENWSPCFWTLEGHTNGVFSVAFSPDSRRLASGSGDMTVRIWDVETGMLQRTLEGHTDVIFSVSFSPDSRRLTSGSDDMTVRIWDVETGALQRTLEGHTSWVRSVVFSPDGRRLASGSNDRTMRIWDAVTGALQRTLESHTSPIRSVAFSPDGRHLACDTMRIWDAETGALHCTLEGRTNYTWSVGFSADGRRLASGGHTVRIWDMETGALQCTLEGHTDWVRSVSFSPDKRRLASGSNDDTVRIWDVETRAPRRTLEGHTGWVSSMTLSPAGDRLASGSYDQTVRIWDAETGALQRTLEGHTDSIFSVSFSPDGRRLASGSGDTTVRIWDAETGALQRTLEGHTNWVRSVAFSPDERHLASVSNDRTVRIWEIETEGLQWTLEGHTEVGLSVAFSPDGRWLASGSETVRIWDADTAVLQRVLEGHTSWVMSVAFSPDGQRLASGSVDETVRIWDAETGVLQGVLEIGTSLSTLSFSSDGCNLITELGCIVLDQRSLLSLLPVRTPNWSGYCLHANRSWITWNGKNILWLPPEYRPVRSICGKGTIAIGCSGRVLLISGNTVITL